MNTLISFYERKTNYELVRMLTCCWWQRHEFNAKGDIAEVTKVNEIIKLIIKEICCRGKESNKLIRFRR